MASHRVAGRLTGLKAVRFTVELLRRGVARLLREAPDAIRAAKIDALLVDQADRLRFSRSTSGSESRVPKKILDAKAGTEGTPVADTSFTNAGGVFGCTFASYAF